MFRPNIFANCDANFLSVNNEWLHRLGRLEISLLVENVVCRQKRFVCFTDWLAAFEQRGGVAEWFAASVVAIDKPDEQRRVSDASMQLPQQLQIFRNKARFKNQVLRRISGDRQLRCQHKFRSRCCEPLICSSNQFTVSSQIADRRINLSETNLHVLQQIMRRGAGSNSLLLG